MNLLPKPFYRPYIYSNQINDYHIADTLGNSLALIAAVFICLFLLTSNFKKGRELLVLVVLIFIVYELMQPLLGKPIDIWDIVATVISGLISWLVFIVLFRPSSSG
jgi:glycopeptide antibiotics resistance protein